MGGKANLGQPPPHRLKNRLGVEQLQRLSPSLAQRQDQPFRCGVRPVRGVRRYHQWPELLVSCLHQPLGAKEPAASDLLGG